MMRGDRLRERGGGGRGGENCDGVGVESGMGIYIRWCVVA